MFFIKLKNIVSNISMFKKIIIIMYGNAENDI